MEKKLKALFDLQRFENNKELAKIIEDAESSYGTELSDDTLGLIAAAGEKTLTDEEINALLNNTPGV